MVVAAGAADAEPEEGLSDVIDDLVERVLPGEPLRSLIPADLSGQEDRGRDEEAGRGVLSERVADDLFLDEPVVGRVLIEGTDDVITVGPGVRPLGVHLEPVRVGIPDDIEPVLAPSFSVAGGGEQPIDGGRAIGLLHEGRDLFRCGR